MNVSVVIALPAADKKTRILSLSGIFLALSIALLFLKTAVPVLDFSIYILISFFTGIILIEGGDRWAWIFFAALVLLSLILPVNKLAFLLLYSFFGFYGIIKFYIEKLKSKAVVFLLKLALINLSAVLNFIFAKSFLPGGFGDQVQIYVIIAVASAFIFIYDYVYTLAMVFYDSRIRQMKRGGRNA